MSAENIEQSTDLPLLAIERWYTAASTKDRKFWNALAIAALLHTMLLAGAITHAPRQIGDASGADEGINISVVTEADLENRSSIGEAASPPPSPPPAAEQQPTPVPPPPEPQVKQPETEPAKVEAPPPEVPKPEAKPPTQEAIRPSLAEDLPELLTIPTEGAAAAKPREKTQPHDKPQSQPQSQPQQKKVAKLDLSPPASALNQPFTGSGRSAGFERPPGITRSGANDAFARAVISALQQTMPQLRETLGRVTVRIILNQNGNVVEVQVVRPSNIGGLDQSVMFAVKQTSFPFPPPNSNDADRTFLVTYIYK
jgi:TonB family protein